MYICINNKYDMARTKHIIDWHKPISESLKDVGISAKKLSDITGISYTSIIAILSKGENNNPELEVIIQCKLVELKAEIEKKRVEAHLQAKGITAKVTVEVLRDIYTVRIVSKDFEIYRDCLTGEYVTINKKKHFLANDLNSI